MYNLTFTERERMAYANGHLELAAVCGEAADFEEQNATLFDKVWEFENDNTIAKLQAALDVCIQEMEQAIKLVDCPDFSHALYAARKALEESTGTNN